LYDVYICLFPLRHTAKAIYSKNGGSKVVQLTNKKLIPCKGRTEVSVIKPSTNEGAMAGSSRKTKASTSKSCRLTGRSIDSRIDDIFIIVKEINNDMVEKKLLKKAVEDYRSCEGRNGQSATRDSKLKGD